MEKNYRPGQFIPEKLGIVMIPGLTSGSKLQFATTLVHEALHFSSFISFTHNKQGEKPELRRTGFNIIVRNQPTAFFHEIDEAIITELAMRFDKKLFYDLEFTKKEARARDEFIKNTDLPEVSDLDIEAVALNKQKDGTEKLIITGYGYPSERKKLWGLISGLYEKNKQEFGSKEDIFKLFVKAVMGGQLLPVARLIEKTFGKGSFRKIGEETRQKKTVK